MTSFAGVEGYPPSGIRAILEDHRGNLWIGSSRQGLWRLRGSEVKRFTKENASLSSNSITVLRESPDGSLWIGTMDGGLNRLSRGRFSNYSTEQGLRSNDVTAILCRGPARLGRHDRRQPAPGAERPRPRPADQGRPLGRPRPPDPRRRPRLDLDDGRARCHPPRALRAAQGRQLERGRRHGPRLRLPRRVRALGVPGRVAVVRRPPRRRHAGVSERDRRRHRQQRGVRQVDHRAVREGARGARRWPAESPSTATSCCRRASSSSRCATRRPAWRCRAGCCSATSWKAPTPAGSRPVPAAPRSTRT